MTHPVLDEARWLNHMRLGAEVAGLDISEFELPESRSANLNGVRLHYLEWGRGGKANVLFLHGGGLNAHTWDLVALAMRNEFNVVALDQRGHGDSDWAPPEEGYHLTRYVDDIERLIEHLGWDRLFLVGMSLGGVNSIAFASGYPERLHGLCVIDVGPDLRWEGAARVRDFMAARRGGSLDEHIERALRFNPGRDRRLLVTSLLHNLRPVGDGEWEWKYDPRPFVDVDIEDIAHRQRQLWDVIPQITAPTLVVRGLRSDVFLEDDAAKLVGGLPDGRLVRVDAGHTVQGDNPRELVDMLRMFFRSCLVPPL